MNQKAWISLVRGGVWYALAASSVLVAVSGIVVFIVGLIFTMTFMPYWLGWGIGGGIMSMILFGVASNHFDDLRIEAEKNSSPDSPGSRD